MKIGLVGYRKWALDIYDHIEKTHDHEFLRFNSKDEFSEKKLISFNPDYILFYGWSWIVPTNLVKNFNCVMLHPSPLPKYRGGSPLQNQIINGETQSAVTLFMMDDGIDTGPIISQEEISLEGSLDEIFSRITNIGSKLTQFFLNNEYELQIQDNSKATYFKRRREEDSKITVDELIHKDSTYLINKIRMLQDPYPNPYIETSDGKKLILLNVSLED